MKSALINLSVDIQHYLQILNIRWKQRVSTNFWDNPRILVAIKYQFKKKWMSLYSPGQEVGGGGVFFNIFKSELSSIKMANSTGDKSQVRCLITTGGREGGLDTSLSYK